MSIDTDLPSKFLESTYESYELAVGVSSVDDWEKDLDDIRINLYSVESFLSLLKSSTKLLLSLMLPYTPFICMLILTINGFKRNSQIYAATLMFLYLMKRLIPLRSPVTGDISYTPFGSSVPSGLYYKSSPSMLSILKKCPVLTSEEVFRGDLPTYEKQDGFFRLKSNLKSSSWMWTGDMRTIIPFLTNSPPDINYSRRWVRVPINSKNAGKRRKEISHEAVAVDSAISEHASVDSKDPKIVYVILAGLTGGSKEGYVLDLVGKALKQGIDCYVMLGRGLGGCPLLSQDTFNGSRTEDIVTCAKLLRESLPENTKIFAIGISMGAIIVTNALVKDKLSDYVDGVVSISGCFNIPKNAMFEQSRKLWQPFLVHGLKEALMAPRGTANLLHSIFGSKIQKIADTMRDVYDFDSIMVTNVHGYESVEDYYYTMLCSWDELRNTKNYGIESIEHKSRKKRNEGNEEITFSYRLKKPLLALHALDDPICHVDTLPLFSGKQVGDCWDRKIKKTAVTEIESVPVEGLLMIVTKKGGHVGWPLGNCPWKNRFLFLHTLSHEFCTAVSSCKWP